jgi:hypothetical protein
VTVPNVAFSSSATLQVNSVDVAMTGALTQNVTKAAPVPQPSLTGTATEAATYDFGLSAYKLEVPAFGASLTTVCTPVGTAPPVTPTPTPTATPTPTPTATPTKTATPKPTKTSSPQTKGSPASGKTTFSCVLETLGSPFDFTPSISVQGARAKEGDSTVKLSATMTEIPGLAPVPIDNGTMKVVLSGKMDGKAVEFKGQSSVNAASYGTVPVPTLTAQMSTSAESAKVEITKFFFDFGEMSGLKVYANCNPSSGASLGEARFGVGALASTGGGSSGSGSGSSSGGSSTGGASLPHTGGSPMVMFALWSSALLLMGAAMYLFVPRRRQEA